MHSSKSNGNFINITLWSIAIINSQEVQYMSKTKRVSKYHFNLNIVVLQRCPSLHIILYNLEKKTLFGIVSQILSHARSVKIIAI